MTHKTHRFIQVNLNHSARTQDLLAQTMAEWNIEIGIIAEPYLVRQDRSDWIGDKDGLVAIISRETGGVTPSPPLTLLDRGCGFVAASWGKWKIIGVYFSPNRSVDAFERFLNRLGEVVGRLQPGKIVVAGDMNAKSTLWGSPITDLRGRLLEEWAVGASLICLNRGSVHTYVRQGGGSIVDVSFATVEASRLETGGLRKIRKPCPITNILGWTGVFQPRIHERTCIK